MKNLTKSAAPCTQCAALQPRFEAHTMELSLSSVRSEGVPSPSNNVCPACGAPLTEVANLKAAMTAPSGERLWRFTYSGIL